MNLVFGEYLRFLKEKGIEIEKYKLEEGYYWLDRQIIKAYDKVGKIHKIIRLDIDDKLNITVKTEYKQKDFEIESWYETIERKKERLLNLENESKQTIINSLDKYKDLEPKILSSGGKDSSVVVKLVRDIKPNTQIIFNNTSLDCADTYLHIQGFKNVHITNPKEGFYQWRERLNFIPTRMARACCSIFKEGAMVDNLNSDDKFLFFMGMRNEESNTRSGYGDEWRNDKWGNRDWEGILPIRKWTEEDVWLYILWRKIYINPKYKKGYSRVG